MRETLHMIALRSIRHSEKHNILTAYTLERGRMAFAVTAGVGRSASRLRALLMPLGVVECVADVSATREVHRLCEVRPLLEAGHTLHGHPVKSSLALFVAEFLSVVLRDGPGDAAVYGYLTECVGLLNALPAARLANFHLMFLFGLSRCLGIEPDTGSYREGMVFDMRDGCFRLTAPLHGQWIDAARAGAIAMLGRMTAENMHLFRYSRRERNEVLDSMLQYYGLHYAQLGGLKSLDVLRELF